MKCLLFLTFFFSLATQATTLSYKTIEMQPSPLDQAEKFDLIFEKDGFYSLAQATHGIPSLGINQVYYKSETQFVMVKYGIEGTVPLDELIKTPKGFMIHKRQNNQVYMLYFRGFKKEYVQVMVNRLAQRVSNFRKLQNFLIPSAYADDCSATGASVLNQSAEFTSITASAAWESLKACMSGVGSGVYDSTVGTAKAIGSELWAFASHPIDYTEAVADKVETFLVKTATFMKQLVSDPEQAFDNMGAGLGKTWETVKAGVMNMSSEMKLNFVCSLIGSLGVDSAIAFLTGGAASGKVALTIANLAKKFSMLEKLFSVLSKVKGGLLSQLKLQGVKLEKFMKGLFNNHFPEGDLKHLDDLAGSNNELSLRTLSCYLH